MIKETKKVYEVIIDYWMDLHKECMEKWLSVGNITCVYCRSEVWKDYGANKSLDGNYICLE